MRSGTWNLIFGLVAIAFGASKYLGNTTYEFTLIGTNSSGLLIAAGAFVALLGVYQLSRSRGR
jgi:hypothetical protein